MGLVAGFFVEGAAEVAQDVGYFGLEELLAGQGGELEEVGLQEVVGGLFY